MVRRATRRCDRRAGPRVSQGTRRSARSHPEVRARLRPLSRALAKFNAATIAATGLVIEVGDKPPYARFRDRLMVPIRDAGSRTIGFAGRLVIGGGPKYMFSLDTPSFDKARVVFNLGLATDAARACGRLIVVEGVFDVIALAGAGIDEAVAPLGTAVTTVQIETMLAIGSSLIVAFDGDAAGHRGSVTFARNALPLLRSDKAISFVALPARRDPDDVVRAGGGARFETMIQSVVPIAKFLAMHSCDDLKQSGDHDERAAVEAFAACCRAIRSTGTRAHPSSPATPPSHAGSGRPEMVLEINLAWTAFLPRGWHALFQNLVHDLERLDPGIEVVQANEKFAVLRVYLASSRADARVLIDLAT